VTKAATQGARAVVLAPKARDELNRVRERRRGAIKVARDQLEIALASIKKEMDCGVRADLTEKQLEFEAGAMSKAIEDLKQSIERAGAVSKRNANDGLAWMLQSLCLDWRNLTQRNPAKSRNETGACKFPEFVDIVLFDTLGLRRPDDSLPAIRRAYAELAGRQGWPGIKDTVLEGAKSGV
jgi:hypothetical protein